MRLGCVESDHFFAKNGKFKYIEFRHCVMLYIKGTVVGAVRWKVKGWEWSHSGGSQVGVPQVDGGWLVVDGNI